MYSYFFIFFFFFYTRCLQEGLRFASAFSFENSDNHSYINYTSINELRLFFCIN